jgi:hypothetical protein
VLAGSPDRDANCDLADNGRNARAAVANKNSIPQPIFLPSGVKVARLFCRIFFMDGFKLSPPKGVTLF